jgi:hypothetical protein
VHSHGFDLYGGVVAPADIAIFSALVASLPKIFETVAFLLHQKTQQDPFNSSSKEFSGILPF